MIAQSKNRVTLPRWLVCLLVLLMMACSPGSPIDVSDYTQRLSRALDISAGESAAVIPAKFPRKRLLSFEYAQASIDLLEFLRMGDCELQQLVAERNSSLGRLAQPSQRLVYEINFLRTGQQCADELSRSRPELAGQLEAVLRIKQQELPKRIWEALPGGEEFRGFWSDARSLPDATALEALSRLSMDVDRWLAGDYSVDASLLEQALEQIALGGGGLVMDSWLHLASDLEPATLMLHERYAARPLCYEGMQNPQADILQRVVNRFFLAGVQKEVATLNRVTFDLMAHIRRLETRLEAVEPDAYSTWRKQRDAVIDQGRQSMVDHVAAIRPLFLQCGFLPADAS